MPIPDANGAAANLPAAAHALPLDAVGWLAAIIDSSDDAIVSKTLAGIVTTWNRGAERIFGYTAAEMVGQPITLLIPKDRQQEEPAILERLARGERVDHFETVRRRKNGALIDVSVTISPVRDAGGAIVGVSKIARDITPWKQVQRELSAARDVAERAKEAAQRAQTAAESANAAKDHFLGILSHELRTPLTPALGAVSLIAADASLPPPVRQQLETIRRNIETQARLVDDLLDVTRIARGKLALHFEVVNAHAAIRNVLAMFQNEIHDKALAVRLALRAGDPCVWADAGRFQQVILNLVSNAVKFTPEEGVITLRTRNRGGEIEIEVADTGIGIAPADIPRLFHAFEQAEPSFSRRFGGLGLGLTIVKSLVAMHRGSITLASPGPGQGTTFTLRLPATCAAAARAVPGVPAATVAPARDCRVLLVEDHADTREVMRILLRRFGCLVSAAGNVREALELATRERFELLISDFGLPDGNGADVIARVRELQPVPAIAVTGFGQDDDIQRSHAAGYLLHLTKPVSMDTLARAIQTALAQPPS